MAGLYRDVFIGELEKSVKTLLPRWGFENTASLALICLSENATFKVKTGEGQGDVIIRVHRPDYHCQQEILSELSWVKALRLDGVVNTDDCLFSWFLYDFAAAISFIETSPQIPLLLKSWVEGYRKISPLNNEEVAYIPMFIMLRRILLTAWLASHSETSTALSLGTAYTDGTVQMATQYLRGESGHWIGN